MNFSVRPTRVSFDADSMSVSLEDGRILSVPLAWFPRLLRASQEELAQVEMSSRGLHWETLDEDISVAGLLLGQGDQTQPNRTFVALTT
jgi:hypothetical protein